jgi:prepilin-type N-terminal cleavage/methylation domain-containing protein
MKHASSGLTLVEVLVAVVVLGIGILALTGSSAMVTRMIGRGKMETHAALAASRRVELLRLAAASTSPSCLSPDFASGGPVSNEGLTQSWTVDPAGQIRRVRVTVSYLTVRGRRSAVLETGIQC